MKPRHGVARRSYILDNPDAAAEAIFNAAMRPPERSSRRPPPAELAAPPPPRKKPPRRPLSTTSTTAESLLATPQPNASASTAASASSAKPQAPSINEVLARQQSQLSPKPIIPPYTVSWSVLWRGKEVFSGVKSSEQFDYDTFSGDSIIKVSRKADNKGYKTVLQHATAVVACSGNQANITVQCGDSDEWNDVSGVAKRWLEDKKKGVAVKILHKYDRKEASSDSESSASSTPMSPPKKKRKAQKEKYHFSSNVPAPPRPLPQRIQTQIQTQTLEGRRKGGYRRARRRRLDKGQALLLSRKNSIKEFKN